MNVFPAERLSIAMQWAPFPNDKAFEWVRRIEDAGFDGIWAGDLLFDPFSVLSSYAPITKTLKFGTSIAGWTRTPVTMALTAATVDEVSGGRFRLGLGTLPKSYNENWHDIDTSRMVRRMKEYVEIIRLALHSGPGQRVVYDGEILKVRGYNRQQPALRPYLPIYIGVSMPQMTRLAGEVADGVFSHPVHSLRYLREVCLPNIDVGLRRSGRDRSAIQITPSIICSISNDRAEALHWAKAHICFYVHQPFLWPVFDLHGFRAQRERAQELMAAGDVSGAIDALPDEAAEVIAVAGTPDDCRARLAEYDDFASIPRLLTVRQNVPPDYVEATYRALIDTFGKS